MLKNGVEDIVILAQIVGILAVATYVFSYQFKRRKNIILVNATSSILYVLQYIMLGAFEGAMLDVLSAVSTALAHRRDKGLVAKHIQQLRQYTNSPKTSKIAVFLCCRS